MNRRKFNPNLLVVKQGELKSTILKDERYDSPIRLRWEISIELQDFDLGHYHIFDPIIYFCSFELPFISSEAEFDATKETLNSWKELVNTHFDFSDSWVDNIGDFSYLVKYSDIDKDSEFADSKETYDNQMDIKEIRFGDIKGGFISSEIIIKIEFDRFNRHDPPFRKDWYSDFFSLKVDLEIKPSILEDQFVSTI